MVQIGYRMNNVVGRIDTTRAKVFVHEIRTRGTGVRKRKLASRRPRSAHGQIETAVAVGTQSWRWREFCNRMTSTVAAGTAERARNLLRKMNITMHYAS